MESDMVNYQKRYLAMSWNAISSFMFACKAWNCSFFSTFSPVSKRYPKRYLSDTLLVQKSSQIHPVPRNPKEKIKAQKTPKNRNWKPKWPWTQTITIQFNLYFWLIYYHIIRTCPKHCKTKKQTTKNDTYVPESSPVVLSFASRSYDTFMKEFPARKRWKNSLSQEPYLTVLFYIYYLKATDLIWNHVFLFGE